MAKYEENRTYLTGIIEAMKKTETELSGRLDEIRDQRRMLEESIQALNVYEHINTSSSNVEDDNG